MPFAPFQAGASFGGRDEGFWGRVRVAICFLTWGFAISRVAISCAPNRIQNPSDPQNTPQNTPQSSPETKKKKRKKYENREFSYIFRFFLYFGLRRRFGVYFGVYFGDQRGFVFCRGRRRSQLWMCVFGPWARTSQRVVLQWNLHGWLCGGSAS